MIFRNVRLNYQFNRDLTKPDAMILTLVLKLPFEGEQAGDLSDQFLYHYNLADIDIRPPADIPEKLLHEIHDKPKNKG